MNSCGSSAYLCDLFRAVGALSPKRGTHLARSLVAGILYMATALFAVQAQADIIVTGASSPNNNINASFSQVTSLTTTAAVDLTGIQFQLKTVGGSPGEGDITVELRDNIGVSVLASGTIARSVASTTDTDYTVVFILPFETSAETGTYSIWMRTSDKYNPAVQVKFSSTATTFSPPVPLSLALSSSSEALTRGVAMTSITATPTGGSGAGYIYAVSPALPAGLSLNPTTGTISGTPTAVVASASYTVTVTDGASATATASVTLSVAENVDSVQEAFEDVTTAFIGRRMERIISNEPGAYRFDRRRTAAGIRNVTVSTMGGGLVDLQYGRKSADDRWYAWVEGIYSVYQDSTGSLGQRDGKFGMMSVGADYLLNDRLAFGFMGQFDRASESITGFSDVSGNGWLIGPYVSGEISQGLFFNVRAAMGRSKNRAEIDVFNTGEIYVGNFNTERSLVRAMVYGDYQLGKVSLSPNAELIYMREKQLGYTATSDVGSVPLQSRVATLGQLSLSPEIEFPVQLGLSQANIYIIPKLNWTFESNGTFGSGKDLNGSLEFGIKTMPTSEWNGYVSLRYDGIGVSGYSAISLRSSLSYKF